MTHVCVDDGAAPRVVGWTSLQLERDRKTVTIPQLFPAPPLPRDRRHRTRTRQPINATIVNHTFVVRDAERRGWLDPVIVLRDGDDPTVLPNYRPCDDDPRLFDVIVVARRIADGVDYPLMEVPPEDFVRYRDSTRGLPQYWARDGFGIAVWPEPTDEYEVVDLRRPRIRPVETPPLDAFLGRFGPEFQLYDWQRELLQHMSEAAAVPRVAASYVVARVEAGRVMAAEIVNAGGGYTAAPTIVFGAGGSVRFSRHSELDYESLKKSKERARGLLKSLLTPSQWEEFEASRCVTERIDGCEFKLRPGGMIEAKKPKLIGSVREKWCVAPNADDYMPEEDKLIGQLLHLRAGPDKLRAQANVFPGP